LKYDFCHGAGDPENPDTRDQDQPTYKQGDDDRYNLKEASQEQAVQLDLTVEEQDLLRWAKNSSTVTIPRGMDALQYKKATALEVLVSSGT
jgi:hypothetical protein